jgi:hypothetical protein
MPNEFKVKRGLIISNLESLSESEDYLVSVNGKVETRNLPNGLISGSSQISDLGFVDTTGTPLNNQLAVFTDSNTIEGDSNLVWDGSKLAINGLISASSITANSVTASVFSGSYFDFDLLPDGSEPVWKEGRVFYSAENGSLSVYNSESDITLQVGQEFYIKAKNGTLSTILNGTPVRISGSNGQNPVIYPAVADDHSAGNVSFDNHIIGIATHDISGNGIGFVTEKGLINEINTSAFSAGDILYLQTGSPATPEAHYRNTPPPFPYDIIQAGYVVKSHSSEGIIAVDPKEPIHFGNISGLSGSLIPDVGDLWIYQANNAWTHTKTLSGSYVISDGSLTANSFTGSLFGTSSYALNAHTSSYVEWTGVNNIPSGLISGSSQITNLPTSSISNFDTAVSASAATAGFGSGGGSSTAEYSNILNLTGSYTLQLTDVNKYIRNTTTSSLTVTVPSSSTQAFNVGTIINLANRSTGTLLVGITTGVTINGEVAGSFDINGMATLVKIDTDEWDLLTNNDRYYLWDNTLTHTSSNYDLTNKYVKITVSSGTSISLDSILDLTKVTSTNEHKVQVVNSTGVNLSITTAQKNNFAGTYTISNGSQTKFIIDRDGDNAINIGNAGVYA